MYLIQYLDHVRNCKELEDDMNAKQLILEKVISELKSLDIKFCELKRAVEHEDGRMAHVEYLRQCNDELILNLNSERKEIGSVGIGSDHPLIWKKENLEAELKDITQEWEDIGKNLTCVRKKRIQLMEEVTKAGKNAVEARLKWQKRSIKRDTLLLCLLEEEVLDVSRLDVFEAVEQLVNCCGWNGEIKIRADGDDLALLQEKAKALHVDFRIEV